MRVEIAYLLIALMAAGMASVIVLSWRYNRYRARVMRGHHDKPVWKPFWLP